MLMEGSPVPMLLEVKVEALLMEVDMACMETTPVTSGTTHMVLMAVQVIPTTIHRMQITLPLKITLVRLIFSILIFQFSFLLINRFTKLDTFYR